MPKGPPGASLQAISCLDDRDIFPREPFCTAKPTGLPNKDPIVSHVVPVLQWGEGSPCLEE